ncbi:MAG: hypothetical protein KJO73_12175 [Croceitalea sp.]|nr:hypothetical protein [Croceitalea sp.]
MTQDPNNYWEQLERLEKLIRASEFKAGIVFSFHGLILGFFVDNLDRLRPVYEEGPIFIVLSILWLMSALISIYFCFKCFKPQIESRYASNVFFFQDAVKSYGSQEEYVKELLQVNADENKLFQQLGEQIHAESKIIDEKFRVVQNAIKFFVLSFVFIIISAIIWVAQIYMV